MKKINDHTGSSFDSLQYGAYRWCMVDDQEDEFFLAYYLKIRKNGSFTAMHHNTANEEPRYFSGIIDNRTRQLIDSLEIFRTKETYTFDAQQLYNGNTLALQHAGKTKRDIQFIQSEAPPFIQRLSSALDALAANGGIPIAPFDLNFYKADLEKRYIRHWGKMPGREMPKFDPPDLHKQ